jgi:hypothetical protein
MMPVPPSPNGPDLRDIHLPPAPSWWPLAPGWWMLGALLLLSLVVAGWLWRRRARLQRGRRRLLDELERLAARHARDGDDAALATAIHQLLRRVARRHDATATQQRGKSWRQTLARVAVAPSTLDRLVALELAIYRPRAQFDVLAMLSAARDWLQAAASPRDWKPPAVEPGHV